MSSQDGLAVVENMEFVKKKLKVLILQNVFAIFLGSNALEILTLVRIKLANLS